MLATVIPLLSASMAEDPADSQIGPGLLAFIIVALLGLATFLLIRSMLHHLRKVPPTFDNDESQSSEADDVPSSRDTDGSGPDVS